MISNFCVSTQKQKNDSILCHLTNINCKNMPFWSSPTEPSGCGWKETAVSTGQASTTQCRVSTTAVLLRKHNKWLCVCRFDSLWWKMELLVLIPLLLQLRALACPTTTTADASSLAKTMELLWWVKPMMKKETAFVWAPGSLLCFHPHLLIIIFAQLVLIKYLSSTKHLGGASWVVFV